MRSRCFLLSTWCFFRSLVGGKVAILEDVNVKVAVLLVVVGKVTPGLEGVDVKVESTSIAVVKVETALEVVNVRVAVLEVVSVKVPFFLVGLERGRLHRHIRLLGQPVVECD